MSEFLRNLTASIMAFFIGIEPITVQDEKDYIRDDYYQTGIGKEPNYALLYDSIMNPSLNGEDKCNFGTRTSSTGKKPVMDSISLGYPLTIDGSVEELKSMGKYGDSNKYLFEVEEGTEILAPFNCTLVNSSLSRCESPYPDSTLSLGVCIVVRTPKNNRGESFELTIGSIKRPWCCFDKEADAGEENKPLYKIIGFDNESEINFTQGDVLAESGLTGIPSDMRSSGKTYFTVEVKKSVNDGAYKNSDFKELYKGKYE